VDVAFLNPISVEMTEDGRRAILAVHGDVDLRTAEELQQQATACLERADHVTIDLSEITFMDSSGMKVLVDLSHLARAERRELALRPPTQLGGRRVVDVLGVPGLPWID
jgi:anti-anti-sigma factor